MLSANDQLDNEPVILRTATQTSLKQLKADKRNYETADVLVGTENLVLTQ